MQKLFCAILIGSFVVTPVAQAGVMELGASASYRKTVVTSTNFSTQESYTGSLGYYFSDATALELSYTEGYGKTTTDTYIQTVYFTVWGADFILTFGGKDAVFRPYVKAGAAYITKEYQYKQVNQDPLPAVRSCGTSPSGGAGFRLMLTANFAIKAGAEAWTSPLNENCLPEAEAKKMQTQYDTSYRAGISWLF